jgi:hypothetical protein
MRAHTRSDAEQRPGRPSTASATTRSPFRLVGCGRARFAKSLASALSTNGHTMGNQLGFVQHQHRRVQGLPPGMGVAARRLRRQSCGQRLGHHFAAASTTLIRRHCDPHGEVMSSGRGFAAGPAVSVLPRLGIYQCRRWQVRWPPQSPG